MLQLLIVSSYPKPYQRGRRLAIGLCYGALCGVFVVNFVVMGWVGFRPRVLTFVAPFAAILIGSWVWLIVSHRAWKRRAEAAGYALCTECAYDLSRHELPADAARITCPECGASVHVNDARARWRECL